MRGELILLLPIVGEWSIVSCSPPSSCELKVLVPECYSLGILDLISDRVKTGMEVEGFASSVL